MQIQAQQANQPISRFKRLVGLILCLFLNLQWLTAAAQPLHANTVQIPTLVQTSGKAPDASALGAQQGSATATAAPTTTPAPATPAATPAPTTATPNATATGNALREQLDALAAQPGMGYLAALSDPAHPAHPQVAAINWQAITLAQDSWQYTQQGLTPAGAALVSLVVAYCTAGAGAALIGPAGLGITGAAGSVLTAVTQAAITNLATTATISLANNGGNLSATLNELGSSANVQSLLTSVATAGVVAGLGSINVNGSPLTPTSISGANASGASSPFINQLGNNLINNTASALVSSAINGTDVEQNLQNGIINAFITTSAAQGANAIGTAAANGTINATIDAASNPSATGNTATPAQIQFAQLASHAVAGCIASAATNAATGNGSQGTNGTTNSSACSAGALGAVVGEFAAGVYDPTAANAQGNTVQFAAMMGGIAVAATGGNPAQIAAGAAAAGNAAENNHLSTAAIRQAVEVLKKCTDNACIAAMNNLRSQQQSVARVTEGCRVGRSDCVDQVKEIAAGLAMLQDPSVIAAMGEANATQLYNRQLNDLTKALDAMQYGANTADQRKQIALVGTALVGTALGGWAVATVGRVIMAACSNPAAPACIGLVNEVGIAIAESTGATTGLAGAGTGAAAATVMGQRIANAARLGDEALAAEVRLIQAEGVAVQSFRQERSFWSASPIEFQGNRVYQRNDLIDITKIDAISGLTNLELMRLGRAPIGSDGKAVNLHHMLQSQDGPIAEVTQTFHQQNFSTIHINAGSDIPSGINRSEFARWRAQYWMNRALSF